MLGILGKFVLHAKDLRISTFFLANSTYKVPACCHGQHQICCPWQLHRQMLLLGIARILKLLDARPLPSSQSLCNLESKTRISSACGHILMSCTVVTLWFWLLTKSVSSQSSSSWVVTLWPPWYVLWRHPCIRVGKDTYILKVCKLTESFPLKIKSMKEREDQKIMEIIWKEVHLRDSWHLETASRGQRGGSSCDDSFCWLCGGN